MTTLDRRSFVRTGLGCAALPLLPMGLPFGGPTFGALPPQESDPALDALVREVTRHARRIKDEVARNEYQFTPDDLRTMAGHLRMADALGERHQWKRKMRHADVPSLPELDAAFPDYAAQMASQLTALGLPTTSDEMVARYWQVRAHYAPQHLEKLGKDLRDGTALAARANRLDAYADKLARVRHVPEPAAEPVGGPSDLEPQLPPEWLAALGGYLAQEFSELQLTPSQAATLLSIEMDLAALFFTLVGFPEMAIICAISALFWSIWSLFV